MVREKKKPKKKSRKPKLGLVGCAYYFRYGDRIFTCRHSVASGNVYILSGEELLFTGNFDYTTERDSKFFFKQWLDVFIESTGPPKKG